MLARCGKEKKEATAVTTATAGTDEEAREEMEKVEGGRKEGEVSE